MFPEVWSLVVQGQYTVKVGYIDGYERRAVKAETYPGVIASPTEQRLQGVVYMDVDDADTRRLDLFEGAYYRRVTIPCAMEDGNRIEVELYLFRDTYRHLVTDQPWGIEQFKETGMAQFLANYEGFRNK